MCNRNAITYLYISSTSSPILFILRQHGIIGILLAAAINHSIKMWLHIAFAFNNQPVICKHKRMNGDPVEASCNHNVFVSHHTILLSHHAVFVRSRLRRDTSSLCLHNIMMCLHNDTTRLHNNMKWLPVISVLPILFMVHWWVIMKWLHLITLRLQANTLWLHINTMWLHINTMWCCNIFGRFWGNWGKKRNYCWDFISSNTEMNKY